MFKIIQRWVRGFARDKGVAGLIIAMIIAIVSFSALAVFLARNSGPVRDIARLQATRLSHSRLNAAMFSNYFAQSTSPRRLPCPDTDLDGDADACSGTGTASGTVPWLDLDISRDEALDGYGRYYTYVVAAAPATRELCLSIANDFNAAASPEYTGSMVESTVLEVRTATDTAGSGQYVPFALISHGQNGYGARSLSGTLIPTTNADASEVTNATANPAAIISGPFVENGFDDIVLAPSHEELLAACEELTPAEAVNGSMSDDFQDSSAAIDSTKFATGGTAPTKVTTSGDGVARFTNSTSYLATTTTNYDFNPSGRPVHISTYWTPVSSATQAGFSIVTRATPPPSAGDIFTTGITFRFDDRDAATSSTTGVLNRIYVCDSTTVACTTATRLAQSASQYTLIAGQEYHLEVYDNGDDVWARITQVTNPTNSVTVSYSFAAATDLTGDQRVIFVNGPAQSDIDDIIVGVPMLVGDFTGASSYASSAGGTNMFPAATPSLTVEAWLYPEAYPTDDGNAATIDASVIAGKWNGIEATGAAAQGYRMYLNAGEVHLQIAGAPGAGSQIIETFDSGFTPVLNEWTHVAATYDAATGAVRFFKNGALMKSLTSTITGVGTTGVNDSAALPFVVGGDAEGAGFADFFNGRISDVRVWEVARTQNQIRTCGKTRLPSASCATTNLVVNWRLDPNQTEGGLLGSTTVFAQTGTNGTATNMTYGAERAFLFRAFSTDFCPSGTKVGAYQCDFRTVAQSTTDDPMENPLSVPGNIPALYVKAWGGGGGAYDVGSDESVGGSAGFSAARVEAINSTRIGGSQLDVVVGGAGTGSANSARGAGGGGASGIMIGSNLGLVAGGGGGASFSDLGNLVEIIIVGLLPIDCDDVEDTVNQCGIGGGGGGAGANAGDAADNTPGGVCGGRGGNAGSFGVNPTGNVCSGGGVDPSGSNGGNGAGTNDGGASAIGAGGDGYDASTRGAGGGGGGAVGGEAGGYAVSGNSAFGGGGGSGSSDGTGAFLVRGEAGGAVTAADLVDTARAGDLDPDHTSATQRRRITNVTPNVTGVVIGASISDGGVCIPSGATVSAINTGSGFITMSVEAQGTTAGCQDRPLTITVVGGGTISSGTAGGATDADYAPSYATATNASPGRGGNTAQINGYQGAVVLKW